MRQTTLATAGFDRYAKTTRRESFLTEMEAVVPWAEFCSLIDPFYPKAGNGHRPVGLERILRIYFLQQWFDLSDPGAEESLYDSHAMRRFVGIDLGREPVPDETSICNFRHLLARHDLGRRLFETVHEHLERRGIKVARGTIVDATIISAPSSTKNAAGARDPDMCQTRKGNQWYFGMKAHIGVDSATKVIHTVVATAANVADCTILPDLLHGNETRVWGDQAYRGQREAIRQVAPEAQDFTNRRCKHRGVVNEVEKAKNRTKSRVRAKVEHPFLVIKRVFGFARARYRGLEKNAHRLFGKRLLMATLPGQCLSSWVGAWKTPSECSSQRLPQWQLLTQLLYPELRSSRSGALPTPQTFAHAWLRNPWCLEFERWIWQSDTAFTSV